MHALLFFSFESCIGDDDLAKLVLICFHQASLYTGMRKSKADEKILSYNDVVLRRSDLHILSGPYFLNDRIIEFYFSYLSSCHPSQDILLVPPSIAFWIIQCPLLLRLSVIS